MPKIQIFNTCSPVAWNAKKQLFTKPHFAKYYNLALISTYPTYGPYRVKITPNKSKTHIPQTHRESTVHSIILPARSVPSPRVDSSGFLRCSRRWRRQVWKESRENRSASYLTHWQRLDNDKITRGMQLNVLKEFSAHHIFTAPILALKCGLQKLPVLVCVCVKRVLKRPSLSGARRTRIVSRTVAAPLAPRTSCLIIVQWQKTVGVFRHPDVCARGLMLRRGLGRQRRNQIYARFFWWRLYCCIWLKILFEARPDYVLTWIFC